LSLTIDLKIENILISKSGNIKIIDFGLSNLYSSRSLLTTYCGSLYFAAPELLNAKAYTGPEVDIWSFGIVLYVLVCGKVPFDDQSMAALHAKIKRGFVEYPNWLSAGMSHYNPANEECKALLSRILVVDHTKRATLAEIAVHPWISKGGEGPIENYFPIRLPLTLPLDDEVIRGMRGFEFGTEEEIRQHLTSIIQSPAYVKASEQYARSMEAATSSAIAEKSEKRKPFSLEFYKRRISNLPTSWSENGIASMTSLQFDDPTYAFDPLLSIYFLVREKQERDRLHSEPVTRQNSGLASPKAERALRIPSIPVPEPAHTGDTSYEIATPPSKYTYRSPSTRSRTRSRGDEDLVDAMQAANLEPSTMSPRSKFLDDITGTSKTGGLLRRISHKWSKDAVKEPRKELKSQVSVSPIPHAEIAAPSKPSAAAKKSRELERHVPSSPQHLSPKRSGGLGRSTSISEGDYRKRYATAVSDDETSSAGRSGRQSSPSAVTASLSAQSHSGRARSMGHARHATISAARRANDRQDRDFWSGPLTGPSTIPEEGKESVRDIPSRSNSPREDQYAKPVHLKGLFSVATTSTKPVQKMRADLIRVLDQLGISHEDVKGGFFCVYRPSIDLESVHEPTPHAEEYSPGKKSRRRLSFGAAFTGFGGDKRLRGEGESDVSTESITDIQSAASTRGEILGPGGSMMVQFDIHIVKFPWLSLHGIQFKRVGGDVWQYKNACVKIVAELNW
jgi:hypothetical protein